MCLSYVMSPKLFHRSLGFPLSSNSPNPGLRVSGYFPLVYILPLYTKCVPNVASEWPFGAAPTSQHLLEACYITQHMLHWIGELSYFHLNPFPTHEAFTEIFTLGCVFWPPEIYVGSFQVRRSCRYNIWTHISIFGTWHDNPVPV